MFTVDFGLPTNAEILEMQTFLIWMPPSRDHLSMLFSAFSLLVNFSTQLSIFTKCLTKRTQKYAGNIIAFK